MTAEFIGILLGTAAYALFFLSDTNDAYWGRRGLKILFPMAVALLAAALAVCTFFGSKAWPSPSRIFIFAILSAAFLGLEIYSLAFALPTEASYSHPGEERKVCSTGLYSLCRHPGVFFFGLMALTLCLGTRLEAVPAALFTLGDILLAAYEDQVVFPRKIAGYDLYRENVSFLIPLPRHLTVRRKESVESHAL